MDFSLTQDQVTIQGEITAFARRFLNNHLETIGRSSNFDFDLWQKSAEAGLMGLCISPEFGGKGYDALSTVVALESLGYASEDNGLNFAVGAHLLAGVVPIFLFGTHEQKKEFLPDLCAGNKIASNAMTESTSGSDPFTMQTVALRKGDQYLLQGRKTYCSNAPIADIVITYGLTDPKKGFFGGTTSFILDKSTHNFSISDPVDKPGLSTCKMGEIYFENTLLSSRDILGQEGGGTTVFNRAMDWERICMGAMQLGTMRRLMERAVQFACGRNSGGRPISQRQAISHPLADLQVRIDGSRWLTYAAAWRLDKGLSVVREASTAKLSTSETYKSLVLQLFQMYASNAYRGSHEVERNVRDALASTIYSGTSEIHRSIIARKMGLR